MQVKAYQTINQKYNSSNITPRKYNYMTSFKAAPNPLWAAVELALSGTAEGIALDSAASIAILLTIGRILLKFKDKRIQDLGRKVAGIAVKASRDRQIG